MTGMSTVQGRVGLSTLHSVVNCSVQINRIRGD